MVKKKTKIIWDNEAKKSLRSVYDHLKNKESVRVARRIRREILKQAFNLKYKVVWSYEIIYEVTTNTIYILDIFHTSRDPSNLSKLTEE